MVDWDEAFQKYKEIIASINEQLQARATINLARISSSVPIDILGYTIPILVEILGSNSSTVQESAAYCLRILACIYDGDLCPAIARSGVLPTILELLPESNGRFRKTLLRCVRTIVTFSRTSRIVVVRLGGLEIILGLIDDCTDDDDRHMRKYLLEILSALALSREGRRSILTHHRLPFLIEALRCGSLASRTRAAQGVGLLGRARAVRHVLVENGAIPALVGLLRDGDESAKFVAGNALGIISSHVDYLRVVAQLGAIPLYAELLQGNNSLGKEIVEDVFCVLAVSEESAACIAEHLVRILRGDNEEAKAAAIDVLWDLSGYDHSVVVLRDSGAINLLVNILQNGNDSMKEKAMGAVAQLSCYDANRGPLVEAGVVPILMELLRESTDEIQEFVVETLMNFAEDPLFRDGVSEAFDIPSFQTIQDRLVRIRSSDEHVIRSMRQLSVEQLTSDSEFF